MEKKASEKLEPQLREHRDCLTLTALTLQHLPHDPAIGRQRHYPKGSFVWTAETTDHSLYFLERGQIAIMLSDDAGCEVIIRVLKPGEPFGELCFCAERDRPRKNCAQASVDSMALEVGFDDFMIHMQQDADALTSLAFTFCKRLADAESRIEVLSHRGAEVRIGRLLLQLAATGGMTSATRQGKTKLPIGHDDLARMAAMTRPHVSVTMGKLRDRGLVHYDRSNQLTVDVVRLGEYVNQKTRTNE